MKELKRVPRDKFREYMYAPPLDVPPDYDPNEDFRKGVETGDWADHETAARKVCRLIVEAAEKSYSVKRWLLATQRIGDERWNRLIQALGRETPDIAKRINELQASHIMLNWAVFSAKYLTEKG